MSWWRRTRRVGVDRLGRWMRNQSEEIMASARETGAERRPSRHLDTSSGKEAPGYQRIGSAPAGTQNADKKHEFSNFRNSLCFCGPVLERCTVAQLVPMQCSADNHIYLLILSACCSGAVWPSQSVAEIDWAASAAAGLACWSGCRASGVHCPVSSIASSSPSTACSEVVV
jgi:hypothetical protein